MAAAGQPKLIVEADAEALAQAAAERLMARIADNPGRIAICLTGGSSPKRLYQLLGSDAWREKIPWQRVHWFIGDERFVPESDPLNNMAVARATFFHPDTFTRSRPRLTIPIRAPKPMRASCSLSTALQASIRHGPCSTWF
jgi:6-phosphogluconolactonase